LEASPVVFRDLTYIFLAAIAGGLFAWRVRLPLIIGFVLGGIVISPFTPGPKLHDIHSFEVFAEVGVVLLMFSTGVEFSIRDLMRVKWISLLGAPLGIFAILAVAIAAVKIAGFSTKEGLVVGAAVSVASTMVLVRILTETGHLTATYGRVTIGITLVEDLAVICMTVVIPVFAQPGTGIFWKVVWTLGKALILMIPLVFLTTNAIPRLLRRVKSTHNEELLLLITIAVCLGTAALAEAVGFSVALGAFLAGLSVSGSKDLHDVDKQLVPLRDSFVALFFVSLGTLINPKVLANSLPLLALMVLLIVVVKFLVWMSTVRLFRYRLSTAIAVAAGLTQIGELSFVVVQVARNSGLVGEEIFNTVIAASLITILLNTFIVRGTFAWLDRKYPAVGTFSPEKN
jgi:monovalent cation:H+ antiporter-2, CPA2 family